MNVLCPEVQTLFLTQLCPGDEGTGCFFTAKLNLLNSLTQKSYAHLYLIIERIAHDNFTNVVLNEQGDKVYHSLTHASGFYREVFKKFKGMFERIFMTGVSPVTLDAPHQRIQHRLEHQYRTGIQPNAGIQRRRCAPNVAVL